jgi:K+-transporting ATPase A subunit
VSKTFWALVTAFTLWFVASLYVLAILALGDCAASEGECQQQQSTLETLLFIASPMMLLILTSLSIFVFRASAKKKQGL